MKVNISHEIREILATDPQMKPIPLAQLLRKKFPRDRSIIKATEKPFWGITVATQRRKLLASMKVELQSENQAKAVDEILTNSIVDRPQTKSYSVYEIACLAQNSNLIEAVANYTNLVRMVGDESIAVDVAKAFMN